MQALVVRGGQIHYVDDYPRPERDPNEALIRVTLGGICSTDLEIVKGYTPFEGVLGHEFVGVVEEADEEGWTGRRVVGTINLGCRRCAVCLGDGPEHCPQRTVLGIHSKDGVFG